MAITRIIGPDGLPYRLTSPDEMDDEFYHDWPAPGLPPAMPGLDRPGLLPDIYPGQPDAQAPIRMMPFTDIHNNEDEQLPARLYARLPEREPGILPPDTASSRDYMPGPAPVKGLLLRAMAANDEADNYPQQYPTAGPANDKSPFIQDQEELADSPTSNSGSTSSSPASSDDQVIDYSGPSTNTQNQAKKTGLLSQFTNTLARKEKSGFSAKGNDSRFLNPMEQIPGNDPSIPEVQNSDGSWTLPFGANVHPITPFNGQQILKGRDRPVKYSTADIDEKNKIINVKVLMDYQKPSLFSRLIGLTNHVTDEQFEKYARLADEGIAQHWSRKVTLNGDDWTVNVRPERSKDGMPITLANPGSTMYGDLSTRSSNPYPAWSGKLYYDASYGKDADAVFKRTAGHEFGHPLLTDAFSKEYSWDHEGTSTFYGKIYAKAPPYPSEGEINLMHYYNDNPVLKQNGYLTRSIASENDVKTLIHIAGRRK